MPSRVLTKHLRKALNITNNMSRSLVEGDMARPELAVVYIKIGPGGVVSLFGTDGSIAARVEVLAQPSLYEAEEAGYIPVDPIAVRAALRTCGSSVTVGIEDGAVVFDDEPLPPLELAVRLYPDEHIGEGKIMNPYPMPATSEAQVSEFGVNPKQLQRVVLETGWYMVVRPPTTEYPILTLRPYIDGLNTIIWMVPSSVG